MKKLTVLLVIIAVFGIFLGSCNFDVQKVKINSKKPYNFYYTNLLAKNISLETTCQCTVLDTTFYKEKELSEENIKNFKNFLSALNKTNFIKVPQNFPRKPAYKMFFKFSKEKYVVDIYNEQYVTIYPWDGTYEMDYIDMSNVYTSYNLYYICKFLIPRE